MLDEDAQRAVIRGLRSGRRDAWAALYDGYSADVWRYVARLVGGSGAEVADIVQDTFLAAAASARKFDSARGTLWSWLTGIAHHHVTQHWRRANRASRALAILETQPMQDSNGSVDPDTMEGIRRVLADLPSDFAALLTAKYLDNRSLDELAKEFGGSVEAIKSKLARARREFRERFERQNAMTR